MTKRAESKFNVCKKLSKSYNNVWGLPKGDFFRSVRNEREKKKKVSVHGKLLGVKQSLRYFYCNMQEQAFKRALKKSVKSPLTTLDKFVSLLESRLDVVLFRSCLVSSLHQSRQCVSHGVVLVNGEKAKDPGTQLCQSDVVELAVGSTKMGRTVANLKTNFDSRFSSPHLELDCKSLTVVFLWAPNYESTYYPVKANYGVIQRFYR